MIRVSARYRRDQQFCGHPGARLRAFPSGAAQLANMVARQACLMSFGDIFVLLTVLFAGHAMFALLMKKPAGMGVGGGGH